MDVYGWHGLKISGYNERALNDVLRKKFGPPCRDKNQGIWYYLYCSNVLVFKNLEDLVWIQLSMEDYKLK